jgi:hypothetical protein
MESSVSKFGFSKVKYLQKVSKLNRKRKKEKEVVEENHNEEEVNSYVDA